MSITGIRTLVVLFTFAVLATYEVLRTSQFRVKVIKPTYRQLVPRCLLDVGVILTVVLIAYWLVNTPNATSIS